MGNNVFASVSPTSITVATASDIQLLTTGGAVPAGGLVKWATSCTGETPNVDPDDTDDPTQSFTVSGTGSYKLCYRAPGGSDSVQQGTITLTVQAASANNVFASVSPTSITTATASDIQLLTPSTNAVPAGG